MKKNWKAFKLIFWFRFFSVLDVLFSPKFELTTYRKDGTVNCITKFDKTEIQSADL